MKKIFLLLLSAVGLYGASFAQVDTDKTWNDANTAYVNSDYAGAIRGYEQLRDAGFESEKLYLNLGNAYFKRGMKGKAILNYNRALRLSPNDEDILYNLSIANAQVQDKIDRVPEFFVKRWFAGLGQSLSGNTWAVLSLLFLAFTLFGAGIYLLLQRVALQKAGFYGGLVSFVLLVFSVVYAARSSSERRNPSEAVVMSTAMPVKSSPDAGSKELFVLHEGTKVGVRSSLGDWREIRIADGNKGWVQASAIELID